MWIAKKRRNSSAGMRGSRALPPQPPPGEPFQIRLCAEQFCREVQWSRIQFGDLTVRQVHAPRRRVEGHPARWIGGEHPCRQVRAQRSECFAQEVCVIDGEFKDAEVDAVLALSESAALQFRESGPHTLRPDEPEGEGLARLLTIRERQTQIRHDADSSIASRAPLPLGTGTRGLQHHRALDDAATSPAPASAVRTLQPSASPGRGTRQVHRSPSEVQRALPGSPR